MSGSTTTSDEGTVFEPCHIEYDLTRQQRLAAHLGVWGPYYGGLIFLAGGSAALVVLLVLHVSPWFAFLIVLPLWIARGFIVGFVDVVVNPVRHMDIRIEENALGFVAKSGRFWIFLDGVISIEKFRDDIWTVYHHNGTVVNIPVAAIDKEYIDHMRQKGEWGRTPEGIQAAIERGKCIVAMKVGGKKDGESE